MYNLYSTLKTPEHDVLLVRRLHPVSPAPSSIRGRGFELTSCTVFYNILRRFNQMARRANKTAYCAWDGAVAHGSQA
jgi:hypothetical protein